MCCVRFPFCANLSPQKGQLHGFSCVWTVRCWATLPFCANVSPQTGHVQGFSRVWTVRCCVRFPFWANLSPQTGQLHGFSRVWIVMCCVRFPFWVNLLPQREQLKGFSPVWHLICVSRWCFWPNLLPHFEQVNDLLVALCPILCSGILFLIVFKSVWGFLVSCQSPPLSLASASGQCGILSSDPDRLDTKILCGSGSLQSSPSVSVFICSDELLAGSSSSLQKSLLWSCEGSVFFSASSLFTWMQLNGNLVVCSSCSSCSWIITSLLVQKSSFSSLTCRPSGSSGSRLGFHSCSSGTSFLITNCCCTSTEDTEIQTHSQ